MERVCGGDVGVIEIGDSISNRIELVRGDQPKG
jgi:hypothetical protein